MYGSDRHAAVASLPMTMAVVVVVEELHYLIPLLGWANRPM